MNKLSENVTFVPVADHSRKIELSAHMKKMMSRYPIWLLCQHRVCQNSCGSKTSWFCPLNDSQAMYGWGKASEECRVHNV